MTLESLGSIPGDPSGPNLGHFRMEALGAHLGSYKLSQWTVWSQSTVSREYLHYTLVFPSTCVDFGIVEDQDSGPL